MKTLRFCTAAALALAALVVLILALTWSQPVTARVADVQALAASQALPLPYLSDDDVTDAPFDNLPPPLIDGRIAPGEYAGAGKVTFPGHGGDVEVFLKEDGLYLYVAFDVPLFDTSGGSTYVDVYLDTDHNHTMDQTDYLLRVRDDGVTREYTPTVGGLWGGEKSAVNWTAAMTTSLTNGGWQVEYRIAYGKLGITAGTHKELGLALGTVNGGQHFWPPDAYATGLHLWGSLVSSSEWGSFYWKPGPWEDYAPSGMPDFDQRQVPWSIPGPTGAISTHCGPVAMANSLWWFDSKFETLTGTTPPVISDTYPLVWSYDPAWSWDDHDPQNVGGMGIPGLVDDLANNYFNTNSIVPGTLIYDMYDGIQRYLRDHDLWDDYIVTLVKDPDFDWVAKEVMRSEDVILLLGFYEDLGAGVYQRVGGHFVSVAGVDAVNGLIAFSDPYVDNAEAGGMGRVLSGTLITHYPPHPSTPDPTVHNDAGNVSHDIYPITPTASPGGHWGPDTYPWMLFEPWFTTFAFEGVNPHPDIPNQPYTFGPVEVEVEFALAVSPYTWKASGRWVEDETVLMYERRFDPYLDFAPSGVPDWDQKQDNWKNPSSAWSFCGPVAAANSLWWFDSKFEHQGAVPPAANDSYPMVWAYGPWDDHSPGNVDHPATPWPPGGWPVPPPIVPGQGELVEDLALYFLTDQPPGIGNGTLITDLYNGIDLYLQDPMRNLRQGYVITMVHKPEFWWIAEEVERSEDVILLLGFYANPGGFYERAGGHYVTVPGVDKQSGFVAFSDPFWDRMEYVLHPNEFINRPLWTGRVGSDGDPPLGPTGLLPNFAHTPLPHTGVYTLHNDAANVSHDVYRVISTDSPGGIWGPAVYVTRTDEITNFFGMNGSGAMFGSGIPVTTEVEGAVAVSPVADVWMVKTVTPTTAAPGDWVTFTLSFRNRGSLPAENVMITDLLSSMLVNASYTYTVDYTGTLSASGRYSWTVGALRWMEGGVITVTAQVSPDLRSDVLVTNTAEIATSSVEQYQVTPLPNTASKTLQVVVTYGANLTPDTDYKYGDNGASIPYTFTVENAGNVPDSFNLSVSGDDWPTALSTSSVGPLDPSVTTSVRVSVTVPITAIGATFDQATLTAQSVASPTISDTSVFTTEVTVNHSMHQDPANASLVENPSETVTYTLSIYNDGNITDTYDLTHTVASWSTSLSTTAVGPVAPGDGASYQAYVTIPGGASNGASDVVTLTATSQGDPTLSDDSILTTVATTQTIVRGVTVAPSSTTGNGDPGDTVTYTLSVTNTGNVADVFTLGYTGPSTWTISFSANPLNLGAGLGADVEVYVSIPSSASAGGSGVFTVTVTSQGTPTESDAAVLTTYVSRQFIYLPIVLRNYP